MSSDISLMYTFCRDMYTIYIIRSGKVYDSNPFHSGVTYIPPFHFCSVITLHLGHEACPYLSCKEHFPLLTGAGDKYRI